MRSKYSLQKQKPVQLSRDGLPRFSWYVLSAPQADVKSALMKLLMKPPSHLAKLQKPQQAIGYSHSTKRANNTH